MWLKRKAKSGTWSELTPWLFPKGVTKESDIADIILDFAAPLLEECDTKRDIKQTLKFAIIVWNASLAPKSQWREFVANFTKTFSTGGDDGRKQAKHFVNLLHKRKKKYYPDINVVIHDYKVKGRNRMRLKVKHSELQDGGAGFIISKKLIS